jgi:hypothetical protein
LPAFIVLGFLKVVIFQERFPKLAECAGVRTAFIVLIARDVYDVREIIKVQLALDLYTLWSLFWSLHVATTVILVLSLMLRKWLLICTSFWLFCLLLICYLGFAWSLVPLHELIRDGVPVWARHSTPPRQEPFPGTGILNLHFWRRRY